jgi:hypothetical protein
MTKREAYPHPYPTWKTAQFKLGDTFRFIDSMNPLDIRTATVVGWVDTDRVLADYPLLSGVIAKAASIHIKRILPKQL